MSDKIKEYKKNNIGGMSADSVDMFGLIEGRLGEHLGNLQDYDRQIASIDELPDKAYNLVQDLADYSLLESDEAKKQYALNKWKLEDGTVLNYSDKEEQLTNVMTQYASNMRNFFGKHGQRISKTNPYLANKYMQLEGVLVDAVDSLNDGLITQGESQYLKSNLLNPDADKIKNWANMQQKSVEYVDTQNRAAFTKNKTSYEFYDDALSSNFAQITEEGGAYAPTTKSDASTPLYIGESPEAYYLNSTDEDGEPMYEGTELSQMVQDSKSTRNSYIVARAKSYGDMESKNEIYFRKYGVNLMEGMDIEGIDVPDVPTTTTTETTTETDTEIDTDELPEGIERPKPGQSAKIVYVQDEIDKELGLRGSAKIIEPEKAKPVKPTTEINNLFKKYTDYSKKLKQIQRNAPNNLEAINKVKKFQNDALMKLRNQGYNIGLFGGLTKLPKPDRRTAGAGRPRH